MRQSRLAEEQIIPFVAVQKPDTSRFSLRRCSAARPMGRTVSASPDDASFAPCGKTGDSAVSGA